MNAKKTADNISIMLSRCPADSDKDMGEFLRVYFRHIAARKLAEIAREQYGDSITPSSGRPLHHCVQYVDGRVCLWFNAATDMSTHSISVSLN